MNLESWKESERGKPISLIINAAIVELKRLHEAVMQTDEISNHLDDALVECKELRKDKQRLDDAAKLQVNMEIVENCAGNIERYMVALNRHNLDKLICERVAEPANE